MADCYYHGQSSSGPCPECEREARQGLKQGDITATDFRVRAESAHIEAGKHLGIGPDGKSLKRKGTTTEGQ